MLTFLKHLSVLASSGVNSVKNSGLFGIKVFAVSVFYNNCFFGFWQDLYKVVP